MLGLYNSCKMSQYNGISVQCIYSVNNADNKEWFASEKEACDAFIKAREEEIRKLKEQIKCAQVFGGQPKLLQEEQDKVLKEDTQQYRIYKYLEEHGSITPLDAYNDLGITKLATHISEMRAKGFTFKQERESGKNRYNEDVNYMRYFLEIKEK